MADWKKIKTEYISTNTSYRKLAQKYGVGESTLFARASKEKWVDAKEQHQRKTVAKTLDRISNNQADKMARIDGLADQLLEKLEQAITELDLQLYKHTEKTKVIEYNNELRPDKPTKEITHEDEKLLEVKSIIDRQGLKQIASALKDIKEVKMLKTELDKQEQEARISKLRKEAEADQNKEAPTIEVTIAGGVDAWQR